MKSDFSTMPEITRESVGYTCDAPPESGTRRGYFDRISQVFERGVLIFVVLMDLFGNYVHHGLLLKDVLIF